jgi:hypothetical protein
VTITEPKRLSLEQLRGLASVGPPCITIVLPEHEARDARIAFKDALAHVHTKLAASKSRRDIASLLDPLELAATSVIDSSKEPATFVFLRSPDVCESFRTRYLVGQPVAAAGECFHLRPLLALASKHREFYILALQLNDTRIFNARINPVRPRDFRKTRAQRAPASFLAHPNPRFARNQCMIAITLKTTLTIFIVRLIAT